MNDLLSLLATAGLAGVAWFIAAAVLFFNPVVDKLYRAQEHHPAVRTLPQTPGTIGRILLAIAVQVILWAIVFRAVAPSLPPDRFARGLAFGGVLCATKMIPRDVDRLLLTTYPGRRIVIELVIGVVCAFVVGWIFAYRL